VRDNYPVTSIRAAHATLVVESEAPEGVRRVVKKVAGDFERVTGVRPAIADLMTDDHGAPVLVATLGQSPIIDAYIANGCYDAQAIAGKREVFQIASLGDALLVVGSDLLGTIYGAYALAEHLGVSPLHYWGDVEPEPRPEATLDASLLQVSREPSVHYRGFFINDEWPNFGTWTHKTFGGFTAKMYDHVFDLLLRLRGNYLWPAMWSSSFADDGPGRASEELATLYGITVGASHHEPCLRASEEWGRTLGSDSPYGTEWDFAANAEGLTRYWADGLARSGGQGRMVTIGMRGERDSALLGEHSPIADNVELLKKIITVQRDLIAEYDPGAEQMLALYKEVEAYFSGNDEVPGLKDWDGLNDVILMLCDDNFGFVRTLPTPELAGRRFGLYYHLDYHGGPISYEWMPSTPLAKTWEQLCKAYEFGVRDAWVVNVGDLKFNEVSLAHFMAMAYDMESYGAASLGGATTWLRQWCAVTFPATCAQTQETIVDALAGLLRLNGRRRPEAINSDIYHPTHHGEVDRLLAEADWVEGLAETALMAAGQTSPQTRAAVWSMVWLPVKASLNLLRTHLYAAKNRHYAAQGKTVANAYASLVSDCIEADRALMAEVASFRGGKWWGHHLEEHIGFTQWNEFANRYPLRTLVEPVNEARLVVSRKDEARIYHRVYGPPMTVTVDDFQDAGVEQVAIEVANDGDAPLGYRIEADDLPAWLRVTPMAGIINGQTEVVLRCDRSRLPADGSIVSARLAILGDDGAQVEVAISASSPETADLPPMTFLPRRGVIAMNADQVAGVSWTPKASFTVLADHGRTGVGLTLRPVTAAFAEGEPAPSATYRFAPPTVGECTVEVWTTPVNPVAAHSPLRLVLESGSMPTDAPPPGTISLVEAATPSDKQRQILTTVPADFVAFHTDLRWCQGVMDNIRVTKVTIRTSEGVNEVTISPLEPGLIVERILVYPTGSPPPPSYLGPPTSYHTPGYTG